MKYVSLGILNKRVCWLSVVSIRLQQMLYKLKGLEISATIIMLRKRIYRQSPVKSPDIKIFRPKLCNIA